MDVLATLSILAFLLIVLTATLGTFRPDPAMASIIDQQDVISVATLISLLIFTGIVSVHLGAAVMMSNKPVEAIATVWETYREVIIAVFIAYGIIKKPGQPTS